MKHLLVKFMVAAVLLSSSLLPAAAVPYSADTPDHAAHSFFLAIKRRDMAAARALCDVSVVYFVPTNNMDGDTTTEVVEPLLRRVAVRTDDGWILDTNPRHARIVTQHMFDPKNSYVEKTYFTMADPSVAAEYKEQAKASNETPIAGNGFVIFLHRVNGRWLVMRIVDCGVVVH